MGKIFHFGHATEKKCLSKLFDLDFGPFRPKSMISSKNHGFRLKWPRSYFFIVFFKKKKEKEEKCVRVSHSVIRVANRGGGIIQSKPLAFALCISAISPFSSKPTISICTSKTPLDSRKNRNRYNPFAPTNKKSSSSLLLLLLIPPFSFSPNFIRELK